MAALYDKALKRKDYSGVVNKEKKEEEVKPNTPDEEVPNKDMKSMVFLSLIISNLMRQLRQKEGEKEISEGEGCNR